jgi:hypothetical protein
MVSDASKAVRTGEETHPYYSLAGSSQLSTSTGLDKNSYYHEKFLRGRPQLAQTIPRTDVKGKGPSHTSGGSWPPDPNFYAMPFFPDAKAPAASSTLVTAQRLPEAGATSSMASSMGGFAAMDPTLSVTAVAGGLWPSIAAQALAEDMLQRRVHELQEEQQRQQQWHAWLLLSAAAEQDQARHGLTSTGETLQPLTNSDMGLPGYANYDTIGRRALAVAMIKATMSILRDDH